MRFSAPACFSLQVARVRPNSGEVQESAEREALAKVIKHKGKDRQLDKTVIIKNTPEAFRSVFHNRHLMNT